MMTEEWDDVDNEVDSYTRGAPVNGLPENGGSTHYQQDTPELLIVKENSTPTSDEDANIQNSSQSSNDDHRGTKGPAEDASPQTTPYSRANPNFMNRFQ
jgi:hypothetical protein